MSSEPKSKYTNSALRVGDKDAYPQRLVGEFIGMVVSNDWVNEEYKHLIFNVHEHALKAYAGQMFHLLCPSPDGAEVWMRRPMSVYRVTTAEAARSNSSTRSRGAARAAWPRCAPGDDFNLRGPAWRRIQTAAGLEEHCGARPRRRARDARAAVAACGGSRRRRYRDLKRAQSPACVMSQTAVRGLGARTITVLDSGRQQRR